jgi:hypothetical protein
LRRTKELPSISSLEARLHYDKDTGELYHLSTNKPVRANSGAGYYCLCMDDQVYLVHRIVWKMVYGVDPGSYEIDHINGIRNDNRLSNLRLVTSSEQNKNRRLSKRNKSGIKGVCWESSRRKWRATVGAHPSLTLVGRFDRLDDAKEAVRLARERLYGQFANHG